MNKIGYNCDKNISTTDLVNIHIKKIVVFVIGLIIQSFY